MSLLRSRPILQAESRLIALFDRTFEKAAKTRTLDFERELPRNVRQWFGSNTFALQLDKIITEIIRQSLLYTDGQMKKLSAATVKESHILTEEAVRISGEISDKASEAIVRMLKDDAIYYKHPYELAKRIDDLWDGQRYKAVAFAQTFTADVATATTIHRYRQYGVEYMEFDAELDDRTTDQCRCLHGTIFDLSKDNLYHPPLHFRCRSGLVPIPVTRDIDDDMLYENRDFSGVLEDPEAVSKAFGNIDKFNEKYRIDKFVLDQDIAARMMAEKGLSVGISGPSLKELAKEILPSAPATFTQAKTVKEAEQWAVQNLGVSKASYRGLDVVYANEVNRSILSFKSQFSVLRLDEIECVKRTQRGQFTFVMQNVSRAGRGEICTNKLQINTAFFKQAEDLSGLNTYIKSIADRGHWVPVNVEQVIAHELGHTLTFQGLTDSAMMARNYELMARRSFKSSTLSTYGATSDAEGIAECFAKYMKARSIADVETYGDLTASDIIKKYTGVKLK
jgi:SPP1 gp7 family putative phage head morphogenesis protein